MRESPDAVFVYIPLMKELGMSWTEIKHTPRNELDGILKALGTYTTIHAFDGYTADDIGKLSKDKPELRGQYSKSINLKMRMEEKAGQREQAKSFTDLGIK